MKFLNKPGKELVKIGTLVNKQEPTITIITPFYNGGATLEETANTVLGQTYPYFEWIIIDDGSKSESCLKKLDEVSKWDSRIKVFHKENGGPSQARDFGISKASKSTKYIYFLDCDDLIENTMLEEMYWALETHKNASWVYAAMINFGAYEYYWEPYFTLEEELVLNTMCISSMIKKEDLLEVGCFEIKEKAMYEDWNLWLKLLSKGKVPIRLNAPLFWYRTSFSGELSRAKSNHKKAMKLINSTAKKIKNEVEVIQFPRVSAEGPTHNRIDSMTLPTYKKEKQNTVLFLVDNVNLNKNSIATFETIKRLSKDNNCILVMTEPSKNNLRQDIKDYLSEVHDLSNFLDTKDYPLFIEYLINSRNVNNLVINHAPYGYAMLPMIKNTYPNLKVTEIVETNPNVRDEKLTNFIDFSFTTNGDIAKELKVNLVEPSKKKLKEVKVNKEELKEKLGIPKDKIVISYIDNVIFERRPDLFLKIAKNLPEELFFIINGNGRMVMDLKKKIEKKKLTNIIHIPEQENYDDIYKISDIVVNCAYKEGVSSTNYKALLNGVPVVSTTADYQEEIVTDKTGLLVSEKENKPAAYEKEILAILEKLSIYKNNVKEELTKLTNKYDVLADKLTDAFETKNKKQEEISYMGEVYTYYENMLKEDFRSKYFTYFVENHYITPREDFTPGPISKKRRLRTFALKYNLEREMTGVLSWIRQVVKTLKLFLGFIKGLLKSIIMIIPLLKNIIKIVLKLIRKVLSIIKQTLLRIIKK